LTDDMKRSSLKKVPTSPVSIEGWRKILSLIKQQMSVGEPKVCDRHGGPSITICKAARKVVDIAMRSRWPGVPVDVTAPHLKPLLEH
jgi:hypothetical protein